MENCGKPTSVFDSTTKQILKFCLIIDVLSIIVFTFQLQQLPKLNIACGVIILLLRYGLSFPTLSSYTRWIISISGVLASVWSAYAATPQHQIIPGNYYALVFAFFMFPLYLLDYNTEKILFLSAIICNIIAIIAMPFFVKYFGVTNTTIPYEVSTSISVQTVTILFAIMVNVYSIFVILRKLK